MTKRISSAQSKCVDYWYIALRDLKWHRLFLCLYTGQPLLLSTGDCLFRQGSGPGHCAATLTPWHTHLATGATVIEQYMDKVKNLHWATRLMQHTQREHCVDSCCCWSGVNFHLNEYHTDVSNKRGHYTNRAPTLLKKNYLWLNHTFFLSDSQDKM